MKKWLCGFLAAIMALMIFSACTSNSTPEIDAKLCYPDDLETELTTSKEDVVEKRGLVYDEESDTYSLSDDGDGLSIIDGHKFAAAFAFNSDDLLYKILYIPSSKDDNPPTFDDMKEYLDSVYGESEEFVDEILKEEGLAWTTKTSKGTYRIALVEDNDSFFIDVQGVSGDVRSDSLKDLEEK